MLLHVSRALTARRSSIAFLPVLVVIASLAAPTALAAPAVVTAPAADLATSIVSPSMISAGSYLYYTITVHNNGPNTASNVVISDHTPASAWAARPTTFFCVGSGTAWCGKLNPGVSCTTPAVGSPGLVSCTTASLPSRASMTITMVVHLGFYLHNQLVSDSATASSSTPDPNTGNNTATAYLRIS